MISFCAFSQHPTKSWWENDTVTVAAAPSIKDRINQRNNLNENISLKMSNAADPAKNSAKLILLCLSFCPFTISADRLISVFIDRKTFFFLQGIESEIALCSYVIKLFFEEIWKI